MAPLVVFDAAGQPVGADVSARGGQIVDCIASALPPCIPPEAGTARAELSAPLRALGL
jgi:hypothetical protein